MCKDLNIVFEENFTDISATGDITFEDLMFGIIILSEIFVQAFVRQKSISTVVDWNTVIMSFEIEEDGISEITKDKIPEIILSIIRTKNAGKNITWEER